MKLKEHTRNQKRMYRIHKQDKKIHDLELMIGKLQQENKQLKERMEYLERSNDRREDIIIEQRQEISDLEDNWNELKEIIRKKQDYYKYFKDNRYRKFLFELLNKMQELEGSDSNE